ncbi:MFS general substrate transporter, partial [Ramicandelaber brevisporus]
MTTTVSRPPQVGVDEESIADILESSASTSSCSAVEKTKASPSTLTPFRTALVIIAGCMAMGITESYINSYGVIQRHFTDVIIGHDSSMIQYIGTVNRGILNISGAPAGILTNRFGYRFVIILGVILCVVGMLLASFAANDDSKLWLLLIAHGIVVGLGGCFSTLPAVMLPSVMGLEFRGLITGFIQAASGAGGIVFPIIMQKIIDAKGLAAMMRYMAIVVGFFVKVIDGLAWLGGFLIDLSLFRDARALVAIAAFAATGSTFFTIFYNLPAYATRNGLSADHGAQTVAAICGGLMGGAVLGGLASDYLGPVNIIIASRLLAALGILAIWLPSNAAFGVLIVFGTLYGASCGCFFTVSSPLVCQTWSMEKIPNVIGFVYVGFGLAYIVFTPVVNALLE